MQTARLAMVLFALAAGCDGLEVDPSSLRFAGRRYRVKRLDTMDGGFELDSKHDFIRLVGRPLDARHIFPCPAPALLANDFDGDGRPDVGFYSCSWLEIYIDRGTPLSATPPIHIEYRAGRWPHLDPIHYPGLKDLDRRLMRRLDPDA